MVVKTQIKTTRIETKKKKLTKVDGIPPSQWGDYYKRTDVDFMSICKKNCMPEIQFNSDRANHNTDGHTRWSKHLKNSDCGGATPGYSCCRSKCAAVALQLPRTQITHYVFSPQKAHNNLCWCKSKVTVVSTTGYPQRQCKQGGQSKLSNGKCFSFLWYDLPEGLQALRPASEHYQSAIPSIRICS